MQLITTISLVCLVCSFAVDAQKESPDSDIANKNLPKEDHQDEQQAAEQLNQASSDQDQNVAPETKSSPIESIKFESMKRSIEQEASDDVKYSIDWVNELNNREDAESEGRLFQVAITEKEKFVCISPKVMSRENKLRQLLFDNRDTNPFNLIKNKIQTDECLMRREHYWTYMICHGLQITQFHEIPNDLNQKKTDMKVFVLGEFKKTEMTRAELEFMANVRRIGTEEEVPFPTVTVKGLDMLYIEWTMSNGNICDLSQKPRTTRVKYVCSLSSSMEFISMKEVATCEYEALIAMPQLCHHPAFSASDVSKIECAPDSIDAAQYPTNYFKYHAMSPKMNLESILDKKRFYFADVDLKNSLSLGMKSISVQELEDKTYYVKILEGDNLPTLEKIDPKNKDSIESQLTNNVFQNFLNGEMCFTGGSGWWKYEFCYGKHVKQYHEEDGKRGVTILLGSWNLDKHKQHLERNANKQKAPGPDRDHVIHYYSDGDGCETGARQTEVKLKCMNASSQMNSESVQLYLIEPKTCEYTLVFISPAVCDLLKVVDQFGLSDGKLPQTTKQP